MITALNIEDHSRGGLGGVLNIFRHNRLRVEHLYCDTAAVKSLSYERYRGQVSWASIDRFVRSQRSRLLCPSAVELPRDSGYVRFEPTSLSRRMCENAAVWLLRSLDMKGIKTVLIDRSGDSAELCDRLTDLAEPVYVVTEAEDVYAERAEYLLGEKGAALMVSSSVECLRYADLIISPDALTEELRCPADCVILSGSKPAAPQHAPVICDYFFELPKKYADIKPGFLDEMYFASALYELAGARELGCEVFTRCGDGRAIHTRASLRELMYKRKAADFDLSVT